MTLTWREELALRMEGARILLDRDLEELGALLKEYQVRLLDEDRELRQLRAAKQAKVKETRPKPDPDQVPLDKIPEEDKDG